MQILHIRSIGVVLIIAAIGTLTGCSSSPKIVSAWQDPAYKGPTFRKILVVGITERAPVRRTFEDVFAARLREHGIEAVASYNLISGNDKAAARDEIERVVREQGFDAILTTRMVGIDRKTTYTPGYTRVYPGTAYYRDFYGFYSHSWEAYHSPGHVTSYDVVRLETNVYATDPGDLVWTGMTETVDPGKIQKESARLADVIMAELSTRGLL